MELGSLSDDLALLPFLVGFDEPAEPGLDLSTRA